MIQGTREITSVICAVKSEFSKKTVFTSNLYVTLRKELVKSYIWSIALCGAETFDTLEIRSEIPGKFWNMVLGKDGADQLDRSFEKWRIMTQSQEDRNTFIHSFCCLSYDRSTASSDASSPQSVICCFRFQFPVTFLFLKFIQQPHTSSSSSFRHFYPSSNFLSITRFRRLFLLKMWPVQLAFLLWTVCRIFLSTLTLWNISSSRTGSVQIVFSILLQHHITNIHRYSDLLSEVAHTKLFSKCALCLFSL